MVFISCKPPHPVLLLKEKVSVLPDLANKSVIVQTISNAHILSMWRGPRRGTNNLFCTFIIGIVSYSNLWFLSSVNSPLPILLLKEKVSVLPDLANKSVIVQTISNAHILSYVERTEERL